MITCKEKLVMDADNDCDFLQWVHDRLENIHGENFNFDYMRRLRKIIESLKQDKPPRTKVEYVKCESFADVLKSAIDGEVFYSKDGIGEFSFDSERLAFKNKHGTEIDPNVLSNHEFYRRTEIEIDWRDEVVEQVGSGLLRRHGEGFQIGGVFVPAGELVKISNIVSNLKP